MSHFIELANKVDGFEIMVAAILIWQPVTVLA